MGCFVPRLPNDFKFPSIREAREHLASRGFSVSDGGFVWGGGGYPSSLGGIFPDGGGYYSVKSGEDFMEKKRRLREAVESYVPPADAVLG